MNYRSIQDLNESIVNNLYKVPQSTDLIVGVPRSGLLAANILALHLNLPFADVESFVNGRILQSGSRLKSFMKPFDEYKNVLVLEDSVRFGTSIQEAKDKLNGLYPDKNILYSAVYVGPDVVDKVDFYFDICPVPRIFEWNLLHHNFMEKTCICIDGVFCRYPTIEETNDEALYEEYIKTADALLKPSKNIGFLITSRSERYRKLTEEWLSQNNIKHNNLIMLGDQYDGSKSNVNYGAFKASVYLHSNCRFFIENSSLQAHQIASLAAKPVYCIEKRKMIYPDYVSRANGRFRNLVAKAKRLLG